MTETSPNTMETSQNTTKICTTQWKQVATQQNLHNTMATIRIRMSFIASHTYEEFVFVTEATAVQQNDSDRTKTHMIKEELKRTSK